MAGRKCCAPSRVSLRKFKGLLADTNVSVTMGAEILITGHLRVSTGV